MCTAYWREWDSDVLVPKPIICWYPFEFGIAKHQKLSVLQEGGKGTLKEGMNLQTAYNSLQRCHTHPWDLYWALNDQ